MNLSPQLVAKLEAALTEWITAEEWCERTGDTLEAIYSRRQRGTWRDGIECGDCILDVSNVDESQLQDVCRERTLTHL